MQSTSLAGTMSSDGNEASQPALPGIALFTGGGDKPYATGLARSLAEAGVPIDFVGSDELDIPEIRCLPRLRFLNLRGDQSSDALLWRKVARVLSYYARLIRYCATAKPAVFHILWNNKFEMIDRTLLLVYYRALGKRIVMTVHNVNAAARDGHDSLLNRITLKCQYHLSHHLLVHTTQMRTQLRDDFGVPDGRITTIPFGINATVPDTHLQQSEARLRLGLSMEERVALFFGNITPYKGLEHAVHALARLVQTVPDARLLIAGRPKGDAGYWHHIEADIDALGLGDRITRRIAHIPDDEIEQYFKAADVLVLPYTQVFQSGVLFLGYNFGLPAVVSDVGSMRHDVTEGVTGFVCRPRDPDSLAEALDRYFRSSIYHTLSTHRGLIRDMVSRGHSWNVVASRTRAVYRSLVNDLLPSDHMEGSSSDSVTTSSPLD